MIGQINIGTELGDFIYELCKRDDIINIVDIGAWNGLGTTRCIYQSIIDNNKENYLVKSLESNTDFYQTAKNNIPQLDNFTLINGRIIESIDLIDIDKCSDHFFVEHSRDIQKGWLQEDIKNYNNIKNVLSELPDKIDLLILDGGEFSSLAEFNVLKDITRFVVLDDTKCIKNYEVSNFIRNNKSYNIIIDSNDRNGFLVAEKI
jgi:hypothetical protein